MSESVCEEMYELGDILSCVPILIPIPRRLLCSAYSYD